MTGDMNLFICLIFHLCFIIEAYYLNGPGSYLPLQQTALQPRMIWKRIQIDYNTPIYKTKSGYSWPIIQSPRIIFWPVFLQIEDLNLSSSSLSSSSEEDFKELKFNKGDFDLSRKNALMNDKLKHNGNAARFQPDKYIGIRAGKLYNQENMNVEIIGTQFEIQRLQKFVQREKVEKSSIESKVIKLENEKAILANNLEREMDQRSKFQFEVNRLQHLVQNKKVENSNMESKIVSKLKNKILFISKNLKTEKEEKSKLESKVNRLEQVLMQNKKEEYSNIESTVVTELKNEIQIISKNLKTEKEKRSKFESKVDKLQQVLQKEEYSNIKSTIVTKLKNEIQIISKNLKTEKEKRSKFESKVDKLQQVLQKKKVENSNMESKEVAKLKIEIEIMSETLKTERSKFESEINRLQQVLQNLKEQNSNMKSKIVTKFKNEIEIISKTFDIEMREKANLKCELDKNNDDVEKDKLQWKTKIQKLQNELSKAKIKVRYLNKDYEKEKKKRYRLKIDFQKIQVKLEKAQKENKKEECSNIESTVMTKLKNEIQIMKIGFQKIQVKLEKAQKEMYSLLNNTQKELKLNKLTICSNLTTSFSTIIISISQILTTIPSIEPPFEETDLKGGRILILM